MKRILFIALIGIPLTLSRAYPADYDYRIYREYIQFTTLTPIALFEAPATRIVFTNLTRETLNVTVYVYDKFGKPLKYFRAFAAPNAECEIIARCASGNIRRVVVPRLNVIPNE